MKSRPTTINATYTGKYTSASLRDTRASSSRIERGFC
jgi:hypothetical protein